MVISVLGLAFVASGCGPASAKTVNDRLKALESAAMLKPKLDCKTLVSKLPDSNNFTSGINLSVADKRDGYQLVGGSCAFDDWKDANGWQPIMIQVGPVPASAGETKQDYWSCYAKQSAAVSFTITATFCKVTLTKPQ